jgi:hypothetical protein
MSRLDPAPRPALLTYAHRSKTDRTTFGSFSGKYTQRYALGLGLGLDFTVAARRIMSSNGSAATRRQRV